MSYTQFRNRNITPTLGVQFQIGPEDQCADELAIFGGQTRVLASKVLSKTRGGAGAGGSGVSSHTGSAPASPANTTSSESPSTSTPPSSGSDDLRDVHPGFDRENVLTFRTGFPHGMMSEKDERLPRFFEQVEERLRNTAGVLSVGITDNHLYDGGLYITGVIIEGSTEPGSTADVPLAAANKASRGFFETLKVPLLLGRGVRLWDGLEGIEERFDIEIVSSPSGVAHLTFTRR